MVIVILWDEMNVGCFLAFAQIKHMYQSRLENWIICFIDSQQGMQRWIDTWMSGHICLDG